MNADPQLHESLERAAGFVTVDVERRLGAVHRSVTRRGRGRRVRAFAVAAAVVAVIAIVAWQLRPPGDDAIGTGGASGGRIAYLGEQGDARGLFEFDVDTAVVTALTDGRGNVLAAAWSPDGSRLATVTEMPGPRYAIVVTDADGANPVTIVDEPDTGAVGADIIDVAWSPDGSRIAYSGRTTPPRHDLNRTILIVNADESGVPTALPGHWESVSWSPDGERLLVVGFPPEGPEGQFDLYSVAVDGSDPIQLTDDERVEHESSWSPDGSRIVFATGDGFYDQDVFVMDADGSDLRRLTDWEGLDLFPVWSPDGQWIGFSSDRDATAEQQASNRSGEALFTGLSLYAMRLDGSEVRRLHERADLAVPVDWAP